MKANNVKFGFGIDQNYCETNMFDSIEELINYAQVSWDKKDGNPFDEDCDYSGTIFIGTINNHTPFDFAPSLDDIADIMTDSFYCKHYAYEDVQIHNREDAEKLWKEFINKYFNMPFSHTWFGEYSLVEHKWIKKYDNSSKYMED